MALEISVTKANLIARANAQLKAIESLPTVIIDIVAAEKVYEAAKKEVNELTSFRIDGTKKIATALATLMGPEKELKAGVDVLYSTKILPAKKLAEAEAAKIKAVSDEKITVKQWALNQVTAHIAKCRQYILDTVNTVYIKALEGTINPDILLVLDVKSITPENKEILLDYVIENLGAEKKFIFQFGRYDFAKITNEDFDLICKEVMNELPSLSSWVQQFKDALVAKFSDFDLAFSDKSTALQRNQAAFEAEKKEIKSEELQATAVNDFKAQAVAVDATPVIETGKALKRKYVLNMPENTETTRIVMMAALAVWGQLAPKVAKLKQSSFQIGQMMNYLAALKNEDNKFDVQGLIWMEEVK